MSRDGVLKYPPPILLPLEGLEILPPWQVYIYWNFDKTTFYLNFHLLVAFFYAFSSGNAIPVIWEDFWAISTFFFSKFRKCIYISLKPYKMELSKVMKLKNNCVVHQLSRRSDFERFHFYNTLIFKSHQKSGPSRGRRSGGSCFKKPSRDIL